MFESLTTKLDSIFSQLRGRGKLTESSIKDAMREIRLALLEADVNFQVVKDFVERVREQSMGQEVMRSLTPGQQVVKIVRDELGALMGGEHRPLSISTRPPTTILLMGLQGSGKTTTAAKLARTFKDTGHRPMLVAADVYRPAAIDQLRTLGASLDIPVFAQDDSQDVAGICTQAREAARSGNHNILIIDTAGRLQINDELMQELRDVKTAAPPHHSLLVVDAMTGQEAVKVAQAFDADVGINATILTKLDGDARGGAALSIRAVVGKPIQYIGVGEKLDALEPFHPDRMASRILGMGDVLSLIEKAEQTIDEETAAELEQKLRKASFTLEDFQDQLKQIKKLGSLDSIISMIPGMKKANLPSVDDSELKRVEAIISSMTLEERRNHLIINGSRRKRIARGSGTEVGDVNRLIKQFTQTQKMMKSIMGGQKKGKGKGKGRGKFANLPIPRF
ncbi:signal recognition particle protein [Candidatus Entotheonella palauensis]|uniref:signal recognition particle protein n=1 Tax=Candidatus Entotheonella palauensis TaxID=93172 RepID=UPI000B7CD8E9|nr:signal recognition particle protein [Candidatus Entotheonella palauensis]